MNQVKQNLPLALLSLLVLKQLVTGCSLSEMGVAISLCAIVALKDHLEKHKEIKEVRETVTKELEEMKFVVKQQNDVIEKLAKALDENRTSVASIKLSQGMKKIG